LALTEVAAADVDIAVVGQLAASQLPLGNELEPGPVHDVVDIDNPLPAGFIEHPSNIKR
jgi:hypothetical protein